LAGDDAGEVEEGPGDHGAVFHDADAPGLLDDEEARSVAARHGHVDRLIEGPGDPDERDAERRCAAGSAFEAGAVAGSRRQQEKSSRSRGGRDDDDDDDQDASHRGRIPRCARSANLGAGRAA
jgi:hypothetical protein